MCGFRASTRRILLFYSVESFNAVVFERDKRLDIYHEALLHLTSNQTNKEATVSERKGKNDE